MAADGLGRFPWQGKALSDTSAAAWCPQRGRDQPFGVGCSQGDVQHDARAEGGQMHATILAMAGGEAEPRPASRPGIDGGAERDGRGAPQPPAVASRVALAASCETTSRGAAQPACPCPGQSMRRGGASRCQGPATGRATSPEGGCARARAPRRGEGEGCGQRIGPRSFAMDWVDDKGKRLERSAIGRIRSLARSI